MNWFEALVFAFVIIETIQVFFLLRNNRALKRLVEEILTNEEYAATVATNCLFGFMDQVNEDKDKRDTFFSFVATCGVNIAHGAVNYLGDKTNIEAGKPIKTGSKILDGIVNIPQIKRALISKINQGLTQTAKTAVEEVAPGW